MLVGNDLSILLRIPLEPAVCASQRFACFDWPQPSGNSWLMPIRPRAPAQLPQERGGTAPSTAPMEKAKSWLPSMFQRSKHAAKQKDVMKKLKNNLRYAAYWMPAESVLQCTLQ